MPVSALSFRQIASPSRERTLRHDMDDWDLHRLSLRAAISSQGNGGLIFESSSCRYLPIGVLGDGVEDCFFAWMTHSLNATANGDIDIAPAYIEMDVQRPVQCINSSPYRLNPTWLRVKP